MPAQDLNLNPLLTLQSVRSKAHRVLDLANNNALNHFEYRPDRLDATVEYVIDVIQRDFGPNNYDTIPPHGRWQHFEVGGVPRIDQLLESWDEKGYQALEKTRGLIDLFFVSVLLDAGAGDAWKFTEPGSGNVYTRSEGIAVASYYMFRDGCFAGAGTGGEGERKDVVTGPGLQNFSVEALYRGFQIDDEKNPLVGASARVEILQKLGGSLLQNKEFFGATGRPGRPGSLVGMLPFLTGREKLDYAELWGVLQTLLIPIWPSDRTKVAGEPVGDAWPLLALSKHEATASESSDTAIIQPFHKLTQWLGYSLKVPFERLLGKEWDNAHLGTGLPEYRNGGLFVDMGVLTLKPEALERGLKNLGSKNGLPCFGAGDDEIVEWRAMTVALLDVLHERILGGGKFGDVSLSLPQVLEAGSWKAGREIAAEKRPETRSSPILNSGDGTLF
ncbi:URC4/urg3 family protein [Aspergillus undulatus]|uniref:URC4/urg3 family protein n=1 Tax=Aspergillus undulatus TaxID=1810928 RepID=UPI003CCE2D1D